MSAASFSYLREDIQDLRHEIRAMQQRMDGRIDSLAETMNSPFDVAHQRLDTKSGQLLAAMVATAGIIVAAMLAMFQAYLPAG